MNLPTVICEDENFVALNKPAGLLVHNSKFMIHDSPTLVDWLLEKYPEIKGVGDSSISSGQAMLDRPGIVHRLDKDTSGVMIAAKNQEAFDYLKKSFQDGEIKKTYIALALGEVNSPAGGGTGIIDKPIRLKDGSVKRTVWKGKDEKQAVTEYKVIDYLKIKTQKGGQVFSLLKVYPRTGRTHQIRVHLASIGHPIAGDTLYGSKKNTFGLKRQFLHAQSIEFTDMSGKRMKIEADLPEDLEDFMKKLKKD